MDVDASTTSPVSRGLSAQAQAERQRALAAMLRQPLLTADGRSDVEDFTLVRRHSTWLAEWFSKHCQWTLHVRSEMARLRKNPGDLDDTTRPLLDSKGQPFTRRRYAVLCLALAVLEKSERQTVLQRIADDIAAEFASEPALASQGILFDLTVREHRRDLVEVIKYLIGLNVLTRVDGDEQQFVSSQQQDVLYNINSNLLTAMLNVRRGPSTIKVDSTDERIRAMVDETFPDTEDGRHRRLRTRLFRRLLDDPIIYYASLEEDERTYLVTQRPSIVREIENASGLIQEARKEGLAMIDPEDVMTDVRMPSEGTDGHVTLLIAEYLANSLRNGSAKPVALVMLGQYADSLILQFGKHWRKDVSEPGAAGVLLQESLGRLEMLRLIDWNRQNATVTPLPAIARYALGPVQENPLLLKDDQLPLWPKGDLS